MTEATLTPRAAVSAVWRYPVKSMLGPNLFAFHSRLREGSSGDALEITLPDGTTIEGSSSRPSAAS